MRSRTILLELEPLLPRATTVNPWHDKHWVNEYMRLYMQHRRTVRKLKTQQHKAML
jgi:hypothetical protein